MAVLTKIDEQWLRATHPKLIPTEDGGIAGTIEFSASYDERRNLFIPLSRRKADEEDSSVLYCSFEIEIQERNDKSTSQLPALRVRGVDAIPDRHFNVRDNSACLCSPFEELDFTQPEFQFRVFLEKLVVPFLYGQAFYTAKGYWPWEEYAHGVTGILEAYFRVGDESRARDCVLRLSQAIEWPSIKSALLQKPYVKGHTPCFCLKKDPIRRCHPDALKGALRLQQDLRVLDISL